MSPIRVFGTLLLATLNACSSSESSSACPSASRGFAYTVVDPGPHVGVQSRLSVSPDGKMVIAHAHDDTGAVKIATRTGDSWTLDEVPSVRAGKWIGRSLCPAFDRDGRLLLAFWSLDEQDLRLAVRDLAGKWSVEVVDPTPMSGLDTSMTVGPDGTIHLAYLDFGNGDLRYACGRHGSLGLATVDSDGATGFDPSLAVGPDGAVAITFYRCGEFSLSGCPDGSLRYALKTGQGFVIEVVDGTDDSGWYSSLGFDPAGVPFVSYYSNKARQLRFAIRTGGIWRIDVVDTGPGTGEYSSIARQGDRFHVAYFDREHAQMKIAGRNPEGAWTLEAVFPGGTYASLAATGLCGLACAFQNEKDGVLGFVEGIPGEN